MMNFLRNLLAFITTSTKCLPPWRLIRMLLSTKASLRWDNAMVNQGLWYRSAFGCPQNGFAGFRRIRLVDHEIGKLKKG